MIPPLLAPIILTFAPVFFKRTWHPALVLLWGAILAPRKRTVTSALRIILETAVQASAGVVNSCYREPWPQTERLPSLTQKVSSNWCLEGLSIRAVRSTLT